MSQSEASLGSVKETTPGIRPIGLTLSSILYGITGVYYLAYPFLVQDPGILPLYILGAVSLVGSYGVSRMSKWGLWIGVLLFPVLVIAPTYALQVALLVPGLTQNYESTALAASWIILVVLAVLSFIFVLDKRKSFT